MTDAYMVLDDADAELAMAKSALERLSNMVASGELDSHNDADVDALATFAIGIGSRLDRVAQAIAEVRAGVRGTAS